MSFGKGSMRERNDGKIGTQIPNDMLIINSSDSIVTVVHNTCTSSLESINDLSVFPTHLF